MRSSSAAAGRGERRGPFFVVRRRNGGGIRTTVANRALGLAHSRRAQVRPSRASMAAALASWSRQVMVTCRSAPPAQARGHGSARIGRALGVREETIQRLVRGDARTISPQLRADGAISDLYDSWWDKRAPGGTRAERAGATAARGRAIAGNWCAGAALDDDLLDVPGYRPRTGYSLPASAGSIFFSIIVRPGQFEASTAMNANASRLPDRTAQMAPSCDGESSRLTSKPSISQRLDAESRFGALLSATAVNWEVLPSFEVFCHEQLFVLEVKLVYACDASAAVGKESTTSYSLAPRAS